jgi:hypothetical protein
MRQRSIELIEQAKQALKLLACKPCGSPIIPSLERRAGPESVRAGGHRRALGGDITTHRHRGDLPGDADLIHPAVIAQAAATAAVQLRGGSCSALAAAKRSTSTSSATRDPRSAPGGHARGGGINDQCAAPGHEISHRGISTDVSPRAMARRRHPHTEPRQTHNVGGLKPRIPGI